jgi:hypothetical protein
MDSTDNMGVMGTEETAIAFREFSHTYLKSSWELPRDFFVITQLTSAIPPKA